MSDSNVEWYVVHTYAGYEDTVKKNLDQVIANRGLQELIQEVVIPTETVTEVKDDKKREVKRKKFPGYVFVRMLMNTDTWFIVRNTRGCTGFVGPESNNPIPLTEQEVQKFIGGETVTVEVDYSEGESVKVVAGPMEGYIGTVEEIDTAAGRVTVLIDMGGKPTQVEMNLEQVVPLG